MALKPRKTAIEGAESNVVARSPVDFDFEDPESCGFVAGCGAQSDRGDGMSSITGGLASEGGFYSLGDDLAATRGSDRATAEAWLGRRRGWQADQSKRAIGVSMQRDYTGSASNITVLIKGSARED